MVRLEKLAVHPDESQDLLGFRLSPECTGGLEDA